MEDIARPKGDDPINAPGAVKRIGRAGLDKLAVELAREIGLHNGRDAVALDLRGQSSWTDFFVISTVTSSAHLKGLLKRIKDFTRERGLETFGKQAGADGDEWSFVDCGDLVVHLMSERARAFYDLERLWFQAGVLYRETASAEEIKL
jgi:ribosome-associated protein